MKIRFRHKNAKEEVGEAWGKPRKAGWGVGWGGGGEELQLNKIRI